MSGANEHKERQAPDEQYSAAGTCRQMIEMDGKADAKKEREKRKRFQIDAGHQYPIKRTIEPRPVTSIRQELLEDRDPEYGGDVDRHDPEQGDASHDIERRNAIGGRYRAGW